MEIPFKSLRFQQGRSQLWGIQFERQVRRKNEVSHLTPVPIAVGPGIFRLSAAATLAGLEVATQNRRLEVKPYAIGSSATDLTADEPFTNRGAGDAGIDAKWGVTQNLTADFTYNTDFAQVEVDEQQVNLTRFSLFFPEKREFFLEARGIFDFGAGPNTLGTGGGGNNGGRLGGPPGTRAGNEAPLIFFSRRIGLQEGRTVPIVGGGRLTGKVGRFSIGALNMQTDDAPDANALATNFTVMRVSGDILRRSRVGAIFTRRSVSLDRNGENDTYGADASFSFYDNVTINGYYARTRTYGRVGDDTSYQGQFTYDADLFGLQAEHLLVGRNFNPEVGFLRRLDFRRTFVAGHYRPRPRGIEAIRQFTFGGSVDYIENGRRDLETRGIGGKFITEFENSDRITVDLLRSYELLVEPFQIASNVAIPIGGYEFQDVFLSYIHGPAAAGLGHRVRAAGDVLRRRPDGVRVPPGAHRADAADVDRAVGADQPHQSAAGGVHGDGGDDAGDLHVHVADVPVGARAVQLGRRADGDERAVPVGVHPRQRAVRGLQRPA